MSDTAAWTKALRLVGKHRALNRSTEGLWAAFAPHRAQVMANIPSAGDKLLVLGAGNCNDVDLVELARRFSEIHLADIDNVALTRAIARQPPDVQARLYPHVTDVTSSLDALHEWRDHPPKREAIIAALTRPGDLPRTAFDVVVSPGLHSQVVWTCFEALGPLHPMLEEIALAVATASLHRTLTHARPRGTVVFIVDALSAGPDVLGDSPQAVAGVLDRFTRNGTLYPFTNPSFVLGVLSSHGPTSPELSRSPEWVWEISPGKRHLVYAVTARLAASDPSEQA